MPSTHSPPAAALAELRGGEPKEGSRKGRWLYTTSPRVCLCLYKAGPS